MFRGSKGKTIVSAERRPQTVRKYIPQQCTYSMVVNIKSCTFTKQMKGKMLNLYEIYRCFLD